MKNGGKKRANDDGSNAIPDKEHNDATLGDVAFFPGDARMGKVGKNGGKKIGDDAIEPEKFVRVEDNASKKSVNKKIGKGK